MELGIWQVGMLESNLALTYQSVEQLVAKDFTTLLDKSVETLPEIYQRQLKRLKTKEYANKNTGMVDPFRIFNNAEPWSLSSV